jgi:hypothetical protein
MHIDYRQDLREYVASERYRVVIDLYHQLHEDFCLHFGNDAAPEYKVNEYGERIPDLASLKYNPGRLLPTHNGWFCYPEAAVLMRLDSKHLDPTTDLDLDVEGLLFLTEVRSSPENLCRSGDMDYERRLDEIAHSIYERGWVTAQVSITIPLLENALLRAREEVDAAHENYRAKYIAADSVPIPVFRAALKDVHHAERESRLMRLRVHWLNLWLECERARTKSVRGRKISRINGATGCVKPEDVMAAYCAIDEQYHKIQSEDRSDLNFDIKSRSEVYAILGVWYRLTLERCGASDAELRELLMTNQKDTEGQPVLRSWGDFVRTKYNNAINRPGKKR